MGCPSSFISLVQDLKREVETEIDEIWKVLDVYGEEFNERARQIFNMISGFLNGRTVVEVLAFAYMLELYIFTSLLDVCIRAEGNIESCVYGTIEDVTAIHKMILDSLPTIANRIAKERGIEPST